MNQEEDGLRNARSFAANVYQDARGKSKQDLDYNLAVQRNQYAARGIIRSGAMLCATAQQYAKHVDTLVLANLEGFLEGCELNQITVDERLAEASIEEAMNLKDGLIANAGMEVSEVDRGGIFSPQQFIEQVQKECRVSRASVRVIVERYRLKPKEPSGMSIVYQVSGYARVNVNSTDNSTNVITVSQEQIFAKLRQEIASQVPAGQEQDNILSRVAALEAAQNSPTFAQRYADFIMAAANHMTLVAPFLPAFAEMMKKWLGT